MTDRAKTDEADAVAASPFWPLFFKLLGVAFAAGASYLGGEHVSQ